MASVLHRNALRQARRLLENKLGHRIDRFRVVAGSTDSFLGYEYHAACHRCHRVCVVFFPLTSDALVDGVVRRVTAAGHTRIMFIGGRATAGQCPCASK